MLYVPIEYYDQLVVEENPYCNCGHALFWHLPDKYGMSIIRSPETMKRLECSRCDCYRFKESGQ